MKILCALSLVAIACSSPAEPAAETSPGEPSSGEEVVTEPNPTGESTLPPGFPPAHAERPEMSAEQCAEAGAEVVGDIGDGSTHRPDYVCASGAAPIGTVPVGIEGAVCCPL